METPDQSNEDSFNHKSKTSIGIRIRPLIAKFIESDEASDELNRELLWAIRDERRRSISRMNRSLILGLGVALLFELLNRRLIASFSFSEIKLSRLDFLRLILPVVFAFETMRYLLSGAQLILYGKIEGEFTGLRFPKLNESGILTALGNELSCYPRCYLMTICPSLGKASKQHSACRRFPSLQLRRSHFSRMPIHSYPDLISLASDYGCQLP